jgi:hypothetical protein
MSTKVIGQAQDEGAFEFGLSSFVVEEFQECEALIFNRYNSNSIKNKQKNQLFLSYFFSWYSPFDPSLPISK